MSFVSLIFTIEVCSSSALINKIRGASGQSATASARSTAVRGQCWLFGLSL